MHIVIATFKAIFYLAFVVPFILFAAIFKGFAEARPRKSKTSSLFCVKKSSSRPTKSTWAAVNRPDTTNKNWWEPSRNDLDNDIQQLEQANGPFD